MENIVKTTENITSITQALEIAKSEYAHYFRGYEDRLEKSGEEDGENLWLVAVNDEDEESIYISCHNKVWILENGMGDVIEVLKA
jgi:superfamily I DNA/RNA helicase